DAAWPADGAGGEGKGQGRQGALEGSCQKHPRARGRCGAPARDHRGQRCRFLHALDEARARGADGGQGRARGGRQGKGYEGEGGQGEGGEGRQEAYQEEKGLRQIRSPSVRGPCLLPSIPSRVLSSSTA